MPKTFLEYMNYVGGFGLSYAHSAIKPIASLGDTPPKSHKFGRTSAGVNLNADTKRIPRKSGQRLVVINIVIYIQTKTLKEQYTV